MTESTEPLSGGDPPGPRGELFGRLNLMQWRSRGVGFLQRMVETFGDLSFFRLGEVPVYLLHGPDLVQQSLVTGRQNLRKPESLKVSNRGWWGDGLTSMDGEPWRRRKKEIRPLFHQREIERWAFAVVEETLVMCETWSPGQEVELYGLLVELRAAVAARSVLGSRLGTGPDQVSVDEARGRNFVLTAENSTCPYQGMPRPRAGQDVEGMRDLVKQVWEGGGGGHDALSFLARLRDESGRRLELEDVTDELLQMFFAGHLTLTTWLTRVCYVLAARPDLDKKVWEESTRSVQGSEPTADDLPSLPFGEQLIRETGRFFAPAPVLYREVAEPFEVAGYRLRAGAGLWVAPQLMHHDPRFFPEPERFRPERFADGGRHVPRFAYLPFGAGPRVCIARLTALAEMRLVLATLVRRWRFRLPHSEDREPNLASMPFPGRLVLRVEPREEST